MKLLSLVLFLALFAAFSPLAVQGDERPPKLLYAHPERDSDGPYWVAASYALEPDGAVHGEERLGSTLASRLAARMKRPPPATMKPASEDAPPTELACEISLEEAASIRELFRLPRRTVFPPGDFRGWTAASDAVVLGTVTGFVPGFDQEGRPHTLILPKDTEHLYPSRKYPGFVKYAILPYARFVAGCRVFCAPDATHQEYYPEFGDRLLIAADLPADKDGLAVTVMSMSRVVQVEANGGLRTYGQSDFYPVSFAPDFPETLEAARGRAWDVWRDGFVDLADMLDHEEFTRLWRGFKGGAAEAVRSGCFVSGVFPSPNGWTLRTSCSPQPGEIANDEEAPES